MVCCKLIVVCKIFEYCKICEELWIFFGLCKFDVMKNDVIVISRIYIICIFLCSVVFREGKRR